MHFPLCVGGLPLCVTPSLCLGHQDITSQCCSLAPTSLILPAAPASLLTLRRIVPTNKGSWWLIWLKLKKQHLAAMGEQEILMQTVLLVET